MWTADVAIHSLLAHINTDVHQTHNNSLFFLLSDPYTPSHVIYSKVKAAPHA